MTKICCLGGNILSSPLLALPVSPPSPKSTSAPLLLLQPRRPFRSLPSSRSMAKSSSAHHLDPLRLPGVFFVLLGNPASLDPRSFSGYPTFLYFVLLSLSIGLQRLQGRNHVLFIVTSPEQSATLSKYEVELKAPAPTVCPLTSVQLDKG